MKYDQMLAELRAEQQNIADAIAVIERIALGGRRPRGRPSKRMVELREQTQRRDLKAGKEK